MEIPIPLRVALNSGSGLNLEEEIAAAGRPKEELK